MTSGSDREPNRHHLVAEINLGALAHNLKTLRSRMEADCQMCVAIKADAYGHGAELVLPVLESEGVEMVGVATVEEAQETRSLGWGRSILLMGSELHGYREEQKREAAAWLARNQVSTTVSTLEDLETLSEAAQASNETIRVHIMLDTGMTREGSYEEEAHSLVAQSRENDSVLLEGLYTHFATADEEDKSFTHEQFERFARFLDEVKAAGTAIPLIHAANSPAMIDVPRVHLNMVRPGVSVFGCHASHAMQERPALLPVMRLTSFLSLVKEIPAGSRVGYGATHHAKEATTIGVVPVGYADGYDRRLSNQAVMRVGEHIVPVIGRINMDQTVLDLGAMIRAGEQPRPGQEVVVIDDRPASPNNIETLAKTLQTVPHEIMTSVHGRVRRVPVNTR